MFFKKLVNKNASPSIKRKKVDFASLVSHQFKNLLTEIKISLKMMQSGDFGRVNKEQKDILEKVLERNKKLISLLDDLLDIKRIEEKGHVHKIELIDVEDLIESLINIEQDEIKNKKIEFTFQKLTPHKKIKLDKEKMYVALQNVFNNAIKYTPICGRVTVSLSQVGNMMEITFQDSGIGIPENQKEHLFTKFFRASNAIKMEKIGSGLGLFIAKNIIEAHHGKIWFESKDGEGTTFFIKLPVT